MTPLDVKEFIRPYYLRYVFFKLAGANCPPSFRACWTYPWRSEQDCEPLHGPLAGGRDLILLPMADWHSTMQRTQHLALEFASAGNRCFYQSPHLGREYPSPYPLSPEVRISTLRERIHEVHVHLPSEPVYHHRRLTEQETNRITDAYRRLLNKHGGNNPTILVSFPVWAGVALKLRQQLKCKIAYDCHDYFPDFPSIAAELRTDELTLLREADSVFFSSEWLRTKWMETLPDLRQRSSVVRNGFRPPLSPPQGKKDGCDVTVGYVGAMGNWFDVELVEFLARARPNWEFSLVGEIASADVGRLRRFANVSLPGAVPYAMVGDYLASFSAALIPFRIRPLTLAVDPLKLYEYLSYSLPVVSTPLPEVKRFERLVPTATEPQGFLTALDLAISTDSDELRLCRRTAIEAETWRHRAEQVLSAL